MSFNALRASLRTAAPLRRAAAGKALPHSTFYRKYSAPPPAVETPKPKPGNNTALYLGLAGVAAIGVTYYFIRGEDGAAAVKSIQTKAKFVPTKQDYQKVCSLIWLAWVTVLIVLRRCTTGLLSCWTRLESMMASP